ncbi:MAG: hypothetical protein UZ01_00611 [Candidatus Brocadia sinica]|nr:MAG: hypothetical protein UZ01_00611 [Candidatus Brocadia sinica]MCK6468926.1 hypothetical protein [Candidatus Brocadia sinica]NUO04278.1 hypothetical protein [Candidatus Brocadia sinica]
MKKVIVFILMFLLVTGCANSRGKKVSIVPMLDKRYKAMQSIPCHAGLFIEPSLRHFNQEEWQTSMIVGIHHYVFPIGEPLARSIEEMTKMVFDKVTILNELPNRELIEKTGLDVVLTVQLKESELDLIVEESVWRAIGKHYLSIQASLSGKNLNKIFEDEFIAEGKNLDLIDFETEGGWWKTAGPKYGPAVEDSIEKIVFKLAQRLIASREQIETDIP